jgi:CDP-4-dehydro-6-deoxyglucose reductase
MSESSSATKPVNPTRAIRKMEVAKISDYTSQIRELFIHCSEPSEFEFRAGQFVMLHVPPDLSKGLNDENGKPLKPALRAYSIASTDQRKDGFRLVFKYVEGGLASKFVWDLKEGTILDFTGPFGRVFFQEPPTEQVVFLNTGSGVSQHFSFIESNMKKYPAIRYRMLFGVRHESDIYYKEELNRLKSNLKDFEFEYCLSRPKDDWKGPKGYVQNHIERFDYLNIPTTFYLCGNGAMIKDVKTKLEANGFDLKRVFAEAFD